MFRKLILLSIVSIAFSACGPKKQTVKNEEKETCIITKDLKKLIQFETVTTSKAAIDLDLTGSVSYNQDHVFHYQSLASGVVQKVYFNLGDFVQKGQVLFEVRTSELSEQKSSLSIAQSAMKLAERNLKAVANMNKDALASDKELLEAQNELTHHTSEINKIQEDASIQGGSIERGMLVVHAPISGYIVGKNIMSGVQLNAGDDDLFVISDLKKVWVMANVYAAQLGKVKPGESVDITTTAYPGQKFSGKITRLSNIFDPEEKVMKAIIEMDNANMELKPDMMVNVRVHQNIQQDAVAVPLKCAVFSDDVYYVVLYHDDCNVTEVQIEPFAYDADYYYLPLDNGKIKKGDVLVSQNQLLIFNELKGG